jgi:hypothetical protein
MVLSTRSRRVPRRSMVAPGWSLVCGLGLATLWGCMKAPAEPSTRPGREDENVAPIANAGVDLQVMTGDTAALTGSATDADQDPVTYRWRQVGGPTVALTDANTARPTFTAPDTVTRLEFQLVVSDGSADSAPDTVGVDVTADSGDAAAFTWHPFRSVRNVRYGSRYIGNDPVGVFAPSAVAVSGGLAVVTDGERGIKAFDVTDPTRPALVATVDTPGDARGVTLVGTTAYVADGPAGLAVVDLAVPSRPVARVGARRARGSASRVVVSGTRAYVADGEVGLSVFDVSGASAPVPLASLDIPGVARDLALRGTTAFLVGDPGVTPPLPARLYAIDVSTPASPTLRSTVTLPGPVTAVAVTGQHLVLSGASGLLVFRDDAGTPVLTATHPLPHGGGGDLCVDGDTAFVLTRGDPGNNDFAHLVRVDVTTPGAPVTAGVYDLPGDANELAVANGYVFVADASRGFYDFNLARLGSGLVDGSWGVTRAAAQTVVVGDVLYVADEFVDLLVFDVSDPLKPRLRGSLDFADRAAGGRNLVVRDRTVYLAAGRQGLAVVDVSDPGRPVLRGRLDTPGQALDVALVGNTAYVADGTAGLTIADVTDPAAPLRLGSVDTPSVARGVVAAGRFAYVADFDSGLVTVDVGQPAAPAITATLKNLELQRVLSVGLMGDHLVTGDSFGLHLYSGAASGTLAPVSKVPLWSAAPRLLVSGATVFAPLGRPGVQVVDFTQKESPALVGEFDTEAWCYGVSRKGSVLYGADSWGGLAIIEAQPVASSRRLAVGYSETPLAWDLAVEGDFAFVAADTAGLRVFDVREAANPVGVAALGLPGGSSAKGIAVANGRAYVAGAQDGLVVFDVSTPAAPTWLGSYLPDAVGEYSDVAVSGTVAYLTDVLGTGLFAIDVSDPAAPTLLGSLSSTGGEGFWGIALAGDRAFVISDLRGLLVVDVSDPQALAVVATLPLRARPVGGNAVMSHGISLSGNLLAVVDQNSGLFLVDVSTPSRPVQVGHQDITSESDGVLLSDGKAYVATGFSGVQVYDVSRPSAPALIAAYETPGYASALRRRAGRLVIADGYGGLGVVEEGGAPTLEDQRQGSAGSTVRLAVEWTDRFPGADERLACTVTAGACRLVGVDQANHRATVEWDLPSAVGRHQVRVAVGNYGYFQSVSRRVSVTSGP